MNKSLVHGLLLGLCSLALGAQAAGLADGLRGKIGGDSSSSSSSLLGSLAGGGGSASALSAAGLVSPGSAGNAAGVITYCMKNNYLNPDKAAQVKDQLLGKMGLATQKEEPKDEGYLSGVTGMVTGSGGKSFNMDKLKGDLKEKACDYVLDNAQSLL